MTFHTQVYSAAVGAEVDEGIVELLELLVFHNLKTLYSCEGMTPNKDYPEGMPGYIALTADALHFATRLADRLGWSVASVPLSRAGYGDGFDFEGGVVVVRFPKTEIPSIIAALHAVYDEGICCDVATN